jgi:hypothetical protein
MSANLWRTIKDKIMEGEGALWTFIIGLMMLIAGLVMMWEDFLSTRAGLVQIQAEYDVVVVAAAGALFWMSIMPWIGQIGFLTIWSLDMTSRWRKAGLGLAAFFFLMDFVSDVQFRSGGTFLVAGEGVQLTPTVAVASLLTIIFFTIGSEVFVTAGFALTMTLFEPAATEFAKQIAGMINAVRKARGHLVKASGGGKRPSGGGQASPSGLPGGLPGLPEFLPPTDFSTPGQPRNNQQQQQQKRRPR